MLDSGIYHEKTKGNEGVSMTGGLIYGSQREKKT